MPVSVFNVALHNDRTVSPNEPIYIIISTYSVVSQGHSFSAAHWPEMCTNVHVAFINCILNFSYETAVKF